MPKLTIPTKNNLDINRGAISLKVSDFVPENKMHLITIGDLRIDINNNLENYQLETTLGDQEIETLTFDQENIELLISWEENVMWITLYSQDLFPQFFGQTLYFQKENIFNDYISLYEKDYFNGVYQSLDIYSQAFKNNQESIFELSSFKEMTQKSFSADFSQPISYKQDVVIEDTFAPRDGSPILVSDDKGPMHRQFLFNEETGEYSNTVTEYFVYRGQDYENMSYGNIETSVKPIVLFDDEPQFYEEDYHLEGQSLFFNFTNEVKEYFYGKNFTVTYQLERSYNIEFNESVPHDGFRVNLTNIKATKEGEYFNSTEQVKLLREGNLFEDKYLAKEIELNPLLNPQVQGFMYIDKSVQNTQSFLISASSQYLNGNGIDGASIMIEAIDEEGNEVLSPYLSVQIMNDKGEILTDFGKIEPLIGYQSLKSRNTSGRAYYQFIAPILTEEIAYTHRLFVIAYDRKTGVGAQYPLYIQSVLPHQAVSRQSETNNYLQLPFEYFARYFERELPENHPLSIFDKNRNNQLDRSDLEYFQERANDSDLMSSITQELLAIES